MNPLKSKSESESGNNPEQDFSQPRTRFITVKRVALAVFLLVPAVVVMFWNSGAAANRKKESAVVPAIQTSTQAKDENQTLTMADVIERAKGIRQSMSETLHDYTATFVKQERSTKGALGAPTSMKMKVQTPFRSDDGHAAVRVFLDFTAPDSLAGRKVIWGEDLYDGKMAVHEVGMLLSLKTIWLDPNGMIAMQGQRYPISEIGMIKLVDKLIERGELDLDDADLSITLFPEHDFGGTPTELLQIRRPRPSDSENDFSLAEIVIDPVRQLILQYRSFGWPEPDSAEAIESPPLLESYTYEDVKINVGLSAIDFDVKNPAYGFPAF